MTTLSDQETLVRPVEPVDIVHDQNCNDVIEHRIDTESDDPVPAAPSPAQNGPDVTDKHGVEAEFKEPFPSCDPEENGHDNYEIVHEEIGNENHRENTAECKKESHTINLWKEKKTRLKRKLKTEVCLSTPKTKKNKEISLKKKKGWKKIQTIS